MESVKKEISKKMLSLFSLEQLQEYKKKVEEREKEGHLVSLIDMWGLALEYLFQGKVKNKKKAQNVFAVSFGLVLTFGTLYIIHCPFIEAHGYTI